MFTRAFVVGCLLVTSSYLSAEGFNSENYSVPINCEHKDPAVTFDDQNGFNLASAYMMLNASDVSYLRRAKASIAIEKWGFTSHQFITEKKKKRASFGFVAENDDYVLITLRGTANIGDGLMDIFFAPIVPDDTSFKGKYHRGFWRIYKKRIASIEEIIKNLRISKNKKMIITGHSMGGAVARLVAHKLSSEGYNVHSLYAHSVPRVGDRKANEFLANDSYFIYQIAHKKDFISHLPMTPDTTSIFEKLGMRVGYKLDEVATKIIPKLDYRHYAVDMYVEFDKYDAYELNVDSLEDNEVYFWSELADRLMTMPVHKWALVVLANISYHNNEANICAMRGLLAN